MLARPRPGALSLLWVGTCLLVVGCARYVETKSSGSSADDLEALERDFDASAAELAGHLQGSSRFSSPPAPVSKEVAPAPGLPKKTDAAERAQEEAARVGDDRNAATEAPLADAAAPQQAPAAPPESTHGSGNCELMCRALASMKRSAQGICSLAGEAHQRCSSARSRLESAARQVHDAGCDCQPRP